MAKTLWHYDIDFCDEATNFLETNVYFSWEMKPLIVKLTAVKRLTERYCKKFYIFASVKASAR
jgi:hypothetical protein